MVSGRTSLCSHKRMQLWLYLEWDLVHSSGQPRRSSGLLPQPLNAISVGRQNNSVDMRRHGEPEEFAK